ncbi:hypothetical protein WN943_006945 [Citrus x changshan-huyou]
MCSGGSDPTEKERKANCHKNSRAGMNGIDECVTYIQWTETAPAHSSSQPSHKTEPTSPCHRKLLTRCRFMGSPENVPPGTIIDKGVCHPRNNDFYLRAHAGLIETYRPAHYHVLHDEVPKKHHAQPYL